jgi:hypothetical protein
MPERADDPATLDELNQITPGSIPIPPVPVVVLGEVRTQEQPAKLVTMFTANVETARRIAARDPRRAKLTVWCASAQSALLATSMENVNGGTVTGGPVVVVTQAIGPVPLEGIDEIYAVSTTPGTPAIISVMVEQWSD